MGQLEVQALGVCFPWSPLCSSRGKKAGRGPLSGSDEAERGDRIMFALISRSTRKSHRGRSGRPSYLFVSDRCVAKSHHSGCSGVPLENVSPEMSQVFQMLEGRARCGRLPRSE